MYNARNTRNAKMNKNKRKSQNWGSSFLRTKISREPYLLQKRTLHDLKYWEWIFIVISIIGVLINIGFNGYQLTMALINKERYLFPILLIINNLFAVVLLFVGIVEEKPFQILMQLITKTIIWILNLLYFLTPSESKEAEDETEKEVKAIRFYVNSAMLALTVPVGAFVLYQYWTSNMSIFKQVGTEPKYVNMQRRVLLCQSLIGLDVELSVLALMLVASGGLSTNDLFALIVLPVGIFIVVFWALLGIYAVKRESRVLTYIFYISSHLQPLYVIYLIVRSSKDSVGPLLFFSLISVAVLFFITHITLLVVVVYIQLNYGKGLKQAAEKEIARSKSMAQSLAGSAEFLDHGEQRRGPPIQTDI